MLSTMMLVVESYDPCWILYLSVARSAASSESHLSYRGKVERDHQKLTAGGRIGKFAISSPL